ncbi:hypothetical protein ACFQMM_12725 [Saliphagus sp. GCM10025308]
MNRRVGAIVLVVLLCFSGVGPTAGVFGVAAAGATQPESNAFQQDRIDADEVRMDVAIRPDGTAEWTLEFWIRLDDNESEAAFESLRQDIRDDPDNYTQSFADRMTETAATASEATGREMTVDGFDVETQRQSLSREYGVVRYTFDWHGFAAVEDSEIHVGDAIEGIYLDEGTRLLVEWPEGYERSTVAPDPDDERDRAVIWRGGETDFVSGEPRVILAAGGGLSTTTMVAVALAVVALAAGGAWWYRNHDQPAAGTAPEGIRSPIQVRRRRIGPTRPALTSPTLGMKRELETDQRLNRRPISRRRRPTSQRRRPISRRRPPPGLQTWNF